VNIIPDEQFLDRYVFFVDYTYADSNLTFVRRKDENGFHDVRLSSVAAGPLREVDAWLDRFRHFWEARLDALATEVARGKRKRGRS
jgi:hypothetical protein